MRGFKSPESGECFTELRRIIYNFVGTHQGIGKTPAEEVELNLDLGRNRLLNLIFFLNFYLELELFQNFSNCLRKISSSIQIITENPEI